jgi:hypothetical protein
LVLNFDIDSANISLTNINAVELTGDFSATGTISATTNIFKAGNEVATLVDVATASGTLQDQIDNFSGMEEHDNTWHSEDYATESYVSTVSGALQNAIDAIEPPTSVEEGIIDIIYDTDTVSGTFTSEQSDANYILTANIQNLVDAEVSQYTYTITNKSTTGFVIKLSSPVDSGNYKLNWRTGLAVFQSGGDYATTEDIAYVSGVLQDQIDNIVIPTDFYTQSEVDTISGALNDKITVVSTLNYSPANTSYSSTATTTATAGEALTFGQVCYLKSDGKYWKSNATTISGGMPVRAMALETISGSASGNFLVGQGYVRDDSWTWTTAGDIYASTTSGSITQTAVSGTGNVHQILGYATASGTIMFNPSSTYIVRA